MSTLHIHLPSEFTASEAEHVVLAALRAGLVGQTEEIRRARERVVARSASTERFALILWAEFGGANPDDDSDRPPRPLEPDHPFWKQAAGRILDKLNAEAKA